MMSFGNSDPMTLGSWFFLLSLVLFPCGIFVLFHILIGGLARDTVKRLRNNADVGHKAIAVLYTIYLPITAIPSAEDPGLIVLFVVALPASIITLVFHQQWQIAKATQVLGLVTVATTFVSMLLWLPLLPEIENLNPLMRILIVPFFWLAGYTFACTFAAKNYNPAR